jgi:predicted alpha/beta superfamily hydrolase
MSGWLDYTVNGRPAPGGMRLKVLRDVFSPRLGNHRDLLVCLPPSYDADDRRYPVIYMHDGQNLFDPATSFAGAWHVDRLMETLAADGLEAIVVGVPNAGPRRIDEYSPFADGHRGGGLAGDYLFFLTSRVKPAVDDAFRTLSGPGATGIVGSSMGGLVSLFAFFERPDVFGFTGAMSPALWFARRAIIRYVRQQPHRSGRIWLDAGTSEGSFVLADVARMRDSLIEKGYRLGRDLECVLENGGRHDEASWGGRLPAVFRFMLDGATAPAG